MNNIESIYQKRINFKKEAKNYLREHRIIPKNIKYSYKDEGIENHYEGFVNIFINNFQNELDFDFLCKYMRVIKNEDVIKYMDDYFHYSENITYSDSTKLTVLKLIISIEINILEQDYRMYLDGFYNDSGLSYVDKG